MTTSPENALYLVLKNAVDAADTEATLFRADVQPTVYATIEAEKTIRVGNCESSFSPVYNGLDEFDADIPLQLLVKVDDADNPGDYVAARDLVRLMAMDAVTTLLSNPTLDAAVCDLTIRRSFRGWAKINTAPYAVVILPVRVNPRSYGVTERSYETKIEKR